ncbi:MAG: sodium:alanine symporter family protein, partial [Bacteroidetes bacterium]|nr:sodium:alanine symporter family protein [Bacteroidota bacterium]
MILSKQKKLISFLTFIFVMLIAQISFAQNEGSEKAKDQSKISHKINDVFAPIVEKMGDVLFWDPFSAMGIYDSQVYDKQGNVVVDENGEPVSAPLKLIVVWLICGALFFTIFMRFINIRGFKHAIGLVRGKYSNPNHKGEVSHFQALATALSATVGLGNIASVAIAISIGGPGATFWMIV